MPIAPSRPMPSPANKSASALPRAFDGSPLKYPPHVAELSAPALAAQGLAFDYGRGRVVILGEAGMLSAQRIRYPPESGQADRRFGMNAAPGNARFALNILHWLTGLLP